MTVISSKKPSSLYLHYYVEVEKPTSFPRSRYAQFICIELTRRSNSV